MEETILCHVWLAISKKWVIFPIPAWKIRQFMQESAEFRKKNRIVIWFIIWLVENIFFQKQLFFSIYTVMKIILQPICSIY